MKSRTQRRQRYLSYSEIDTALTCWARWDFSYGGRLAGSALRPRTVALVLREGRAWGAAVAAWHKSYYGGKWPDGRVASYPVMASLEAHAALYKALEGDAAEAARAGRPIAEEELADVCEHLAAMLDHYMATAAPLQNLTLLEHEVRIPLPARSGRTHSNRYGYHALIDGYTVDEHGHHWLVEFKLRRTLHAFEEMQLMPQYRWYCWAFRETLGDPGPSGYVRGIIVDERLNEAPKQPKLVREKRRGEGVNGLTVSHDKAQIILPEDYIALCAEYGVEPHEETVSALGEREWQKRIPIQFRPDELVDAGVELTSAAKLIRDLDSGELVPIRNGKPQNCRGCRFKAICPAPDDNYAIEAAFERTTPKRMREEIAV